jgi:segregation and condensation protein B
VDADLVHAVEALLFASGAPLATARMAALLDRDTGEIVAAVRILAQQRATTGVVVERIGGGWQLRTAPRFREVLAEMHGAAPRKLSKAAMEVLAAVAYEQPCTRTDVEALRGVDSGGVLKSLLDRGLVRVAGRSTVPGRPLLYRTTRSFLELFSLPDLASLPTLADRKELEAATEGQDVPRLRDDAVPGASGLEE